MVERRYYNHEKGTAVYGSPPWVGCGGLRAGLQGQSRAGVVRDLGLCLRVSSPAPMTLGLKAGAAL
jgi:hypothetical protein